MSAITADVVPLYAVPCDLLSYCGTMPGRGWG
jgi:hypothetical protein